MAYPLADYYNFHSLTVGQEEAVIAESARGVSATVLADRYGVSRRTIYRIRARARSRSVVIARVTAPGTADIWEAPFAIDEVGPRQVGPWRPVMEVSDP